jgi:hypothetical protein
VSALAKAGTMSEIIKFFMAKMLIFSEDRVERLITADGFDEAILGVTNDPVTGSERLIYDYERCIQILIDHAKVDEGMANEFMRDQVMTGNLGAATPLFVNKCGSEYLFGVLH